MAGKFIYIVFTDPDYDDDADTVTRNEVAVIADTPGAALDMGMAALKVTDDSIGDRPMMVRRLPLAQASSLRVVGETH